MRLSFLCLCVCAGAFVALPSVRRGSAQAVPAPDAAAGVAAAAALRAKIEASPRLPFVPSAFPVALAPGQEPGMISSVALDPKDGAVWILQRGEHCPPVLEVGPDGRVLRSFGAGAFGVPHALRLDRQGHVWTVDAGSSRVIEWSREGKKLLTLNLADRAKITKGAFLGATDIAFGTRGDLFVTDGYVNARVVEYTGKGKKVREFGQPGRGPGQFALPHSIVADEHGTSYVADRENGRIQRFDSGGKYEGEIAGLGRTYALALGANGTLWATMQPMNEPPGAPGWIVQMDRTSGKLLGYLPVPERGALHTLAVDGRGEPWTDLGNGVLVFRAAAPAQPAR